MKLLSKPKICYVLRVVDALGSFKATALSKIVLDFEGAVGSILHAFWDAFWLRFIGNLSTN